MKTKPKSLAPTAPRPTQTNRGKRLGAVKGLLVRALKHGYKPKLAHLTVWGDDALRLRVWAKNRNQAVVEAFRAVLDCAKIPAVRVTRHSHGPYEAFIQRKLVCDKYPSVVLGRIQRGDYDAEIAKEFLNS